MLQTLLELWQNYKNLQKGKCFIQKKDVFWSGLDIQFNIFNLWFVNGFIWFDVILSKEIVFIVGFLSFKEFIICIISILFDFFFLFMYFRNTESVNSSHTSLTNSDSNLPNEKGSSPSSSDMKSESAWQKFRKSVSIDFLKKQSEKKELRETQRKFYETV